MNAIAPHAAGSNDLGDRARHRDDGVGAAILETRADVSLEPEIDSPSDDDACSRAERAERGQGGGVRGMRMHDPGIGAKDQSPQRERGNEIELSMRREPHDLDTSGRGAPRQLILTARHDHRAVTAIAHSRCQPQDLTLAAAPAALRVDVQDRQQARVPREVIS